MKDKDLFGNDIKTKLFKAATIKDDNGFMMCACGQSGIDNNHYVVTTNSVHIDEIPQSPKFVSYQCCNGPE